ncbi:DUF5813 family protein [Natrinema gelatinilyticum]|uniref:DUF5813 family protein n=1 Tax=Natrinema gelatinilyticum TaxID=2961571 RepID=UPI0020C29F5E|nr:DUF5813 family protein [Natrinema gelatinilyticum]
MTDLPEPVERELESHDAFDRRDDGFALTTTVFETTVTAEHAEGNRDGRFRVTVFLPTLDAAVADEVVAAVVEDGWFETLERRLQDIFGVAHTSTHDAPVVERDGDEVRVRLEYTAWDAAEGVEDAKALIEFVEGTFAQGIIPGYEYRGPAASLLENAQNRGQRAADDDGGMPL